MNYQSSDASKRQQDPASELVPVSMAVPTSYSVPAPGGVLVTVAADRYIDASGRPLQHLIVPPAMRAAVEARSAQRKAEFAALLSETARADLTAGSRKPRILTMRLDGRRATEVRSAPVKAADPAPVGNVAPYSPIRALVLIGAACFVGIGFDIVLFAFLL